MLDFALGLRQRIGHWLNGLKKRASNDFSGPIADKRRILIVADVSCAENREAVGVLKSELRKVCPNSNINIAGFYNKKKGEAYNLISDEREKYFTDESVSFFFKFKDDDIMGFLAAGYDVAIFFTQRKNALTDFASAYVSADLRIGWRGAEIDSGGILNFCVQEGEKPKVSVKNIMDAICMIFK